MAPAGEVTDKVTVASVEPGLMVTEVLFKLQVQPEGQVLVRLKTEEPQPAESVFWIE